MQQYSPVLGNKLQFPETWEAVIVQIGPDGFSFKSWSDMIMAYRYYGDLEKVDLPRKVWLFYHFHEMIHATQHQEKENRQFCMMVDMVSWYCRGPGTVSGLNSAPELPF
jgi:hypothetical protein